jgi:ABC-type multidrug transport system ATPase subunit
MTTNPPSTVLAPLLQVERVSLRYAAGHLALDDVSLALRPGILGLLGPNGAGKSSLMRLLATLTRPTAGRVLWRGRDIAAEPDALRVALGYLPQDFGVYAALSAREFLRFLAAVKGLPPRRADERIEECLAHVGLTEDADRRLGGYSGGMRQRVGIAQALLNDPTVLILDEPTVGLDPGERLRFRHLLTDLAGERLVLLSTHIVSDVEASATAIAVLLKGRLQFDGAPETLLASAQGRTWEMTVPAARVAELRARHAVSQSIVRPGGVQLRLVSETRPGADAQPVAPTLEDAYVRLAGGPQAPAAALARAA